MKKIPAWPSLSIHENTLKICVSVKVLGVTIQIYLNWDCQVLSSANRKLSAGICLRLRIGYHTGDMRPVLEYVFPVWHSLLMTDQVKKCSCVAQW